MEFIRNLRLRTKLFLLLFLLALPLLYFVQVKLRAEISSRNALIRLRAELTKAENLSSLLHEFQREWGLAAGQLNAPGDFFLERFERQTARIDELIHINRKPLMENTQISLYLNGLQETRSKVLLGEDPETVNKFYLDLIRALLYQFDNLVAEYSDPEIFNYIRSHYDLTKIKERLNRGLVIVLNLKPGKPLSLPDYESLVRAKAGYDLYVNEFDNHAPPALRDYFNTQAKSDTIRRAHQGINKLLETGRNDTLILNHADWYTLINSSQDRFRAVETFIITWVKSKSASDLKNITSALIIYFSTALLVILLSILIAVFIVKIITNSVNQLRKGADKIARGETDIPLTIKGKDEIADLARSFQLLLLNSQDLAVSADLIRKGNYEVDVNIRSNQDKLGYALEAMRKSLRESDHENRKRNWMQKGMLELSNTLAGDNNHSVALLSEKALHFIAQYLNSRAAVFYVAGDEDQLKLAATYAVPADKVIHKTLVAGETLTGEVYRDNKPMLLTDIPKDFYSVATGLGESQPKNVLIYPFSNREEVLGVIELAFIDNLRGNEEEFLAEVSEKIALALTSIKSRQQLEDLLYRTQQQAEELEAQQEELRQVNEELTENTRMLQSSEEELKVQQEELQVKNGELEDKARQLAEQIDLVNRKHQEVEDAKKLLEQRNIQLETTSKYKSEFLANMSHELRTPLNSILILTKLLAENKQKNLSSKQIEFAETVYRSGNDLLKLINEILDLSKIEAGKTSLNLAEFSPLDLDIKNLFEPLAKERNIDFEVHYSKSLPEKLLGDKDRITQILRNLLSNAFKFTSEEGRVRFEVSIAPKTIGFRNPVLKEASSVVAFEVSDTGIGIPQDKLDLIFEAFQQVDSSTSRKYGGTGLGLSISKELATIMGGEIDVYSKQGEGSTFTLYLPTRFEEETPATHESASIQEAPLTSQLSFSMPAQEPVSINELLIIEDDETFGKLLLDLSVESGRNARRVGDGTQAISYLKKYTPEAVILDIGLPGVSGKTILEFIESDPRLNKVPCYVLSGTARKELKLSKSVNFLRKPVLKEQIESVLEALKSGRRNELRKILIVDNDINHNKEVTDLLCNAAINCTSVHTAKDAMDKVNKERFDCIILDLELPDQDGYELMKEIKKMPGFQHTPMIVLSGQEINEKDEKKIRQFASTIICKNRSAFERLQNELGLFMQRLDDDDPRKSSRPKGSKHSLTGKRAMIVDDDIRNIYALSSVLEDEGMNVVTAGNGIEAIDKLNAGTEIDIILMDIMMPVMDGYEAMRKIRKKHGFERMPIIALTAKAMPGDRARCIEAGASDYIPKPVNTEQLIPLLKVWLYP